MAMGNYSEILQPGSLIEFCNQIQSVCENYIDTPTEHGAVFLYNALPDLLVYLFGSPTKRGWIQTVTNSQQTMVIKNLLSIESPFISAMFKISLDNNNNYVYDLVMTALPEDVQNILVAGNIANLPKVYRDSVHTSCFTDDDEDGCPNRIKFNMIQFYLYYFASVPSFPQLMSQREETFNSRVLGSCVITGETQSIISGAYGTILNEYLIQLVPIGHFDSFPPIVGSFFFTSLTELWIRSRWICRGDKSDPAHLYFLTKLIRHVVRQDVRLALANQQSLLYYVYSDIKHELFLLLTRLACNWGLDDDFLQVMDLWAIWAAPWKRGATPRSLENEVVDVVSENWCVFIFDNLHYYILLMELFLQRFSTFRFPDTQEQQQQQQQQQQHQRIPNTMCGEFRILLRAINVLKAQGVVDYLSLIEEGLNEIYLATTIPGLIMSTAPVNMLSIQCFGSENYNTWCQEQLNGAFDLFLKITGGAWKPKGLYSACIQPRSELLSALLDTIHNETLIRMEDLNVGKIGKSKNQMANQMNDMYKFVSTTFRITDVYHFPHVTRPFVPENDDRQLLLTDELIQQNENSSTTTNLQTQELFLNKEQVQAVQNGTHRCSTANIEPLGIRATEHVRSYELAFLVRWTRLADTQLNRLYHYVLPAKYRPPFFPEKVSIRPLSATVNFTYGLLSLIPVVILLVDIWFPLLI